MIIRRLHPHIEPKRVEKKRKRPSTYVENKKLKHKKQNATIRPRKYYELSDEQKQKLKERSIAHSIKATKGETARMRAIRRRRRREYLRIKYKLQNRTKVCTICKENKALSDFDLQKDKRHSTFYRRSYCFLCRKKMNAEAYQKRKANANTF